jgi:hypothetical protein
MRNRPDLSVTAGLVGGGLGLRRTGVNQETAMSQQSVRQAARRSALDAHVAMVGRCDFPKRVVAGLALAAMLALRYCVKNGQPGNGALTAGVVGAVAVAALGDRMTLHEIE